MSSPFLGEIKMFAGNFNPRGYALCNGQILPIQQNTALFSLLGTNYGGNGTSTFALPNMQSNVPIGQGSGPGLTPRVVGETGGEANVTLLLSQMPQHNHTIGASTTTGADPSPNGELFGSGGRGRPSLFSATAPTVLMATPPVAGGGVAHNNMQPYLAVTFIIATQGIFPARN